MSEEDINHWKIFKTAIQSFEESSSGRCQSLGHPGTVATPTECHSVTHLNSDQIIHGSTITDFNEAECGEPLVPQHLVLDFTPTPGDEAVIDKCCKFWNFIHSRPDLKEYMVNPTPITSTHNGPLKSTPPKHIHHVSHPEEKVNTEGIDCLLDDKVITEVAFATMQRCLLSYCDEKDDWSCSHESDENKKRRKKETALRGSSNARPQHKEVKALCKEMSSFDQAHPRSFDPPKHGKTLHHALLCKIVR